MLLRIFGSLQINHGLLIGLADQCVIASDLAIRLHFYLATVCQLLDHYQQDLTVHIRCVKEFRLNVCCVPKADFKLSKNSSHILVFLCRPLQCLQDLR